MKRTIAIAAGLVVIVAAGSTTGRAEPSAAMPAVATPRVRRAAELAHPWGGATHPATPSIASATPTGDVLAPVAPERESPPVLRGVVTYGARRLALWETAAGTVVTAVGETVGTWMVAAMTATQVTLVRGGETTSVPLTEEP